MMTLAEAQAAIAAQITRAASSDDTMLIDAVGRFVAREIRSVVDNPAFDNSAMDGYALCRADLVAANGSLPLLGESSCGSAPGVLKPGTAMRIFTGAPIPAGADWVVMQEQVTLVDRTVTFTSSGGGEDFIRRRGEDFRAGDVLFGMGRRLSAYDIALLSAAGVARVPVWRRPRVLVVATGSELVPPGQTLRPGEIHESNRVATILQLRALGADVVDGGIVPDQPDALREILKTAAEYDFVITSGGASVGDHDLVKGVFAQIGTIQFWRVKIKPGKPVAFGRVGERTHFFALPGNPVSSLITFKLFVEPAIYAWHGAATRLFELEALAENDFRRTPGRMEFLRAQLRTEQGRLYARALPGQGSHMLGTLRMTNGLIKIGEDSPGFRAGERITTIPMSLEIE